MFENYRRVIAKNRQVATGGLCTCLHANMRGMSDDPIREDWPLGPALKRAREQAGISAREASRRTAPPGGKPLISSGRWYQLETGWQKNKGVRIPIGTTAATIASAARAVEWDVGEALQLAGFRPTDVPARPKPVGIAQYDDEELLAEVRRRMKGERNVMDDPTQSGTSRQAQQAQEGGLSDHPETGATRLSRHDPREGLGVEEADDSDEERR
jgi:hypothetical protein